MAYELNTTYRIKSFAGSGRNLNVNGNEQVSYNRNVCLWTEDTSANAQKWIIQSFTAGLKIITALSSTYALNYYWVNGQGYPGNCDIYPHENNDQDSCITLVAVNASENIYMIKLSNYNLYMTAASDADNANVSWEEYTGAASQQWKFVSATTNNSFHWPTESSVITQYFISSTEHNGIDIAPIIADNVDDDIYAIADGIVERKFDWKEGDPTTGNGSMGICLFIKHDSSVSSTGKYFRSIYMHLNSINNLNVGDFVTKGQIIGYMGHTGNCDSSNGGNGTHLHYSLKINDTPFTNIDFNFGTFVNPLDYSYEY